MTTTLLIACLGLTPALAQSAAAPPSPPRAARVQLDQMIGSDSGRRFDGATPAPPSTDAAPPTVSAPAPTPAPTGAAPAGSRGTTTAVAVPSPAIAEPPSANDRIDGILLGGVFGAVGAMAGSFAGPFGALIGGGLGALLGGMLSLLS